MDQVTRPGRYSICNRERPDAAEALSRDTEGPLRRGLTNLLRLSHGRLEAGPGGGPAFRSQTSDLQAKSAVGILRVRLVIHGVFDHAYIGEDIHLSRSRGSRASR